MSRDMRILLAAAFVTGAVLSDVAAAASCITDGADVTVSGTVHHRTQKPDPEDNLPGGDYFAIVFDRPVCVNDGGFGSVPHGRTASLSLADQQLSGGIKEGRHVTATGQLSHKTRSTEPPEALILSVTKIN